jgi:NitT/TauT family transport system substrate-binding protein
VLKQHGILDSGDALRLGIGAMTDARWAAFLKSTAEQGLYPKDLDLKKAYTLQFINKKVGLKTGG